MSDENPNERQRPMVMWFMLVMAAVIALLFLGQWLQENVR